MKLVPKKHLSKSRLRHCAFMLAAAFGLALLGSPAAQAFTIDDRSNTNPDGIAKFSDTDARRFGSSTDSGKTTIKQGNTTLQFGRQRSLSDERYNVDRMFNPNGRPADDR